MSDVFCNRGKYIALCSAMKARHPRAEGGRQGARGDDKNIEEIWSMWAFGTAFCTGLSGFVFNLL
jgi:hypothetical protein